MSGEPFRPNVPDEYGRVPLQGTEAFDELRPKITAMPVDLLELQANERYSFEGEGVSGVRHAPDEGEEVEEAQEYIADVLEGNPEVRQRYQENAVERLAIRRHILDTLVEQGYVNRSLREIDFAQFVNRPGAFDPDDVKSVLSHIFTEIADQWLTFHATGQQRARLEKDDARNFHPVWLKVYVGGQLLLTQLGVIDDSNSYYPDAEDLNFD